MICITGDVHHRELDTADQRWLWQRERRTEVEVALDFVERVEAHGLKATLFVTGRCFVDEPEATKQLCGRPDIEIGGHTYDALQGRNYRRLLRLAHGSPHGSAAMQRQAIDRTLALIEDCDGRRPLSWRDHAYIHDDNTFALLRQAGVWVVSDAVDPLARGPQMLPNGLCSLPINVIPDHEHLFHARRTPDFVAQVRRKHHWCGPFGSRSYTPSVWADMVIEQVDARERSGDTSTLLLHPLCQYLADGFASLDRILGHLSRYQSETVAACALGVGTTASVARAASQRSVTRSGVEVAR